jgi:hypothetical protein
MGSKYMENGNIPLAEEYNTLRSELLQLFAEQSRLIYVSALTSAGMLFGLIQSAVPLGYIVAVLEVILAALALKSIANYNKIYRIGSYLKVVFEQQGIVEHIPPIDKIGWHYRSREIGWKSIGSWKWGVGARVDGRFLRFLGSGGFLILISQYQHIISGNIHFILSVILAFIACWFLWSQSKQLYNMSTNSKEFEYLITKSIKKMK